MQRALLPDEPQFRCLNHAQRFEHPHDHVANRRYPLGWSGRDCGSAGVTPPPIREVTSGLFLRPGSPLTRPAADLSLDGAR